MAFPLRFDSVKIRLEGLFGDVRVRRVPVVWAVRRMIGRLNRFPGVLRLAKGDVMNEPCSTKSEVDRREGDKSDG